MSCLTAMPAARIALAVLIWGIAATAGWPQSPASPPPAQVAPQPSGPPSNPQPTSPSAGGPAVQPPPANPGLFDEMGKVLEKSLSILPPLKSPSETLDDLKNAARNAGEGLSRLTVPSSMAEGRIKCPVAAIGGPDCKAAADKLCQAKGLKQGKSLSTDSVEACSPKVMIPGRTRKPDDCRTDTFVIRALCQ